MASGKDIASRVPAPDKLGSYSGGDDGDEAAGDTEADENKAARVARMQSFLDVLGLSDVDAEKACDELEAYLDSR